MYARVGAGKLGGCMGKGEAERETTAKHTFLVLASQQSGVPETLANTWSRDS